MWFYGNFPAKMDLAVDSTGQYAFVPTCLPQVMTYNAAGGKLDTITVGPDANGRSFRQTLGYTGDNVTSISAWVLVP